MIVLDNQHKQVVFMAPPNHVGQEFAWILIFLKFQPQSKKMHNKMQSEYFLRIGRAFCTFLGIGNAVGAFCHLVSSRGLVVMVVVGGKVWYPLVLAITLLSFSFSFLNKK
jgi:hypothetical protein